MDEVTHKAKIMDMKHRLKQPEIEPMQILITEDPKTRMKTEYEEYEDYDEVVEDDE